MSRYAVTTLSSPHLAIASFATPDAAIADAAARSRVTWIHLVIDRVDAAPRVHALLRAGASVPFTVCKPCKGAGTGCKGCGGRGLRFEGQP